MKKTILTILVLALAYGVSAQKLNEKKAEKVAIGIKVGGNLAQYHYFPDLYALNDLDFDKFGNRLNPMFGLNVEIPLLKGVVYVAPEVLFDVRGDSRVFESHNVEMRYRAIVNYLELRVPLAIAVPVTKNFKPYVFAAPSFSLALPSVGPFKSEFKQYALADETNSEPVEVNAGNIAPYDYGIALGIGLRYKINLTGFSLLLKLEGGYYNGLSDTFSEKEHLDQAQAVNAQAYNINYDRSNRGFEAALTIAVPLDFHSADDCFYWSDVQKKKNKNRGYYGF